MRIVKKKIPIYPGRLTVVIAKDFEKALKKLNLSYPGFNLSLYDAFATQGHSKQGYSRFNVFLKPNSTPAVIAHEVVHLVNYIFSHMHIELDRQNDEPQAYLTGWITSQVYKAIKKKKKTKS